MFTMHRSPSMFVLLLMAATWSSFFLVADARQLEPAHAAGGSCIGRERDALLSFKQGINDTYGYLKSWQPGRQDCCHWAGIACNNATGHVIQLDLSETNLEGQISHPLLSLEHLEYLSLSDTALTGPNGGVPKFLGSFKNLTHLDLSFMGFSGTVPPQLGNLSKLEYLDLAYSGMMYSRDISWLTRLPLLVYLDMSCTNLSSIAADWPLVVNMLPSLEYLRLNNCSLSSADQFLEHLNLTNLYYLNLSFNYFGHPVASAWFWNVTSIRDLYLLETSLYGPFPNALGNMTFLRGLYFLCDQEYVYPHTTTCNNATMTVDLRNLCDLEELWLEGSLSSGNITEFLEKLPQCPSSRLQYLSLKSNNMVGAMEDGLGQLTSLIFLELSYNNITGSIPVSICNLSHLENLDLSNNRLTGHIPPELWNCTSLQYIFLSSNHLIGQIPQEIASCTQLQSLILSNNLLTGHVPSRIGMLRNLSELDLSNNNFDGVITNEHLVTLESLRHMDLSNNSLSGPLPLEYGAQGLIEMTLSFNHFIGHIPESICNLRNLLVLDLSHNFLEGELPRCSRHPKLVFLHLSNNRFSGKFPPTLQNYSSLAFMDLSTNNFNGSLPLWIGDLVNLRFLQLSHNFLSGDIPVTITNLKRLRQLSLAGNGMSGVIPWSLSNLKSMTQKHPKRLGVDMSEWYASYVGKFREVWSVVMKRQELKYGSGVFDVVSIDLSQNHLVGGIPESATSLNGLLNLNLSWNHLSGQIPAKIGAMKSIESLDLSKNNLVGEIPASLSDLTYLSYVDLSYNNLTGRIPSGRQLDTLYLENPSIFTGNMGLCGPPLERNCSGDNATEHVNNTRSEKLYKQALFFYFGLGSGFVAGLWVVFCALLFNKVWRVAYFRLFDRLYANLYVFVVVNWGRTRAKETNCRVAREIK